MSSQIFTFLFVLITICLQNQVLSSPLILWSRLHLHQSPVSLSVLSPLDLISDSICKLTNEQIQLQIFAVNNLAIEDIQRGSGSDHSIILDAKNEQTSFRYFPNVADDAYKTFLLLPRSNNMKCSHIHFQLTSNVYETLPDALNAIEAKIASVGKNPNSPTVIVLINRPSSSRRRRQADYDDEKALTKSQILNNQTCMFYAENLYWNDANGTKSSGRVYNFNGTASLCAPNTTTTGNQSSVILDLVWNNNATQSDVVNMRLIATIINQYWYLEKAILNNAEYRYFAYGMYSMMDTPVKFCYVCTTATFVRYDSSTPYGTYNFSDKFYLENLQFQPFYVSGSSFGQPNYCTSFFTSGIWMGITSSLLCLAILLFGIHRIMAIKSNDRFDDPKGKPLIIKAQE